MKKLVYFACIALVALWSVSCNKELKPEENVNPVQKAEKVKMTFTAGIQTKAFVEDGASSVDVKWSDSDHIAVWDGTEWCDFAAKSVDGSTAVFEGEITPDEAFAMTDFKAVYPYGAITDPSSETISVSVPSAQVVPSGGVVDPAALVSVATCSAEGLLSFEQVCALVKINLTLSGMSALTLEGAGLAGTVVCAADGSVTSSSSLENTITLSSADGTFALDGDPAAADYFVAVLPGTSEPLKVGMVRESDGYTGIRSASSVTFEQGKAKVYIKDSAISDWEYNISTPDQLKNCASQWSSSFIGNVNLCEDIDMSSISSSWPVKDFAGVLNGNNKKIYNYTFTATTDSQNAVFMNSVSGTVKDICFGSEDGVSYDGVSAINLHNTGSSTGWFYGGVFARFNNGAKVTGITNFIPVTVELGTTVKTRLGGLVGIIADGATSVLFEDCVNYGAVSNLATSAVAASNLGGIIGRCDVAIKAKNVVNKGSIHCVNPRVIQLGGFSSGLLGGSELTGCKNFGDISYEIETLSATTYIGGLLGNGSISYTNKSTLTDCENSGSITIVDEGGANLYCGGITGIIRNVTLSGCKNHGQIQSAHMQVSRLGGISGTVHANTVLDKCENDGEISLTQESETNAWQGVGGIIGNSENTKPVITNCVNKGEIKATFYSKTTHNNKCSAGGIAGALTTADNFSGNINYAKVSASNVSPDSPYCYVGGLVGHSYSGSSLNGVSNNKNYGSVENQSTDVALSAAGGLYGCMGCAAAIAGDSNFGEVKGVNAGAVAGVNAATITAIICDAVTVNGVTKASASDEGAWLCPSNTGTITPTYVAHSSSE